MQKYIVSNPLKEHGLTQILQSVSELLNHHSFSENSRKIILWHDCFNIKIKTNVSDMNKIF